MAALSPKIQQIAIRREHTLKETNNEATSSKAFDHENSEWGFFNFTSTEKIQNLNSLTFQVRLKIFDIFDKNGTSMYDEWMAVYKLSNNIQNDDEKQNNKMNDTDLNQWFVHEC